MVMERVLVIIMAGGLGERLQPLTMERAKAAVPFGGKYRLIDFTLSNHSSRYLNLGDWVHFFSYGVFDGTEMKIEFFLGGESALITNRKPL